MRLIQPQVNFAALSLSGMPFCRVLWSSLSAVWQPGQGFVRYNMDQETLSQRTEREWAERQLRAERRKNIRLGIFEPLDVTMERVAALHASSRVAPALRDNAAAIEAAQRRHAAAVATVEEANRRAEEDAQAAYEEATEAVRLRNQAKVCDCVVVGSCP